MNRCCRIVLRLVCSLVVVLVAAGCGAGPQPSPTPAETLSELTPAQRDQALIKGDTFVGRVANSDAFVAVVVNGTQVTAYTCDGTTDKVSLAEWFKGNLNGNAIDLTNASPARLSAQVAGSSVAGSITLANGQVLNFSLDRVQPGTVAELVRGEDLVNNVDTIGGVIVLPNGDERGALKQGNTVTKAPFITVAAHPSYCFPIAPCCHFY